MSRFLNNAENIWEAAESALRAGHNPSDLTILIGGDGAIRMLADCDWPLDSLCRHHGAQMVYRVHEDSGKLRVEGKSGAQTCTFETRTPKAVARELLGNALVAVTPQNLLSLGA